MEEIGALLRDDVGDPSLAKARIVGVSLSVDYRHAKVHYRLESESEDPELRKRADAAFVRATGFLRSQIAVSLDTKRTPDLRFVYGGAWSTDDADEGGER